MTTDRDRLAHILECIDAIERYAALGRDAFDAQELIQCWMIHHIAVAGEAASKVSKGTREQFPEIPWGAMIGMRNRLVHDYLRINHEIVWNVVIQELPALRLVLASAIAALDAAP